MKKQLILQLLDKLPDEIDIEQFIDKFIILKKIEDAEERLASGQGVDHAGARRRLQAWLR
jgi:hypothetical protein